MHKFEKMLTGSYGDYVHCAAADIILQLWGLSSDTDTVEAARKVCLSLGTSDLDCLITYAEEIRKILRRHRAVSDASIRDTEWLYKGDLGWFLVVGGSYVADGFEPSEKVQRGAVIARRISGDLKKKEDVVEQQASDFYEVRGNFVLLKSGGPSWDSIINLSGVSRVSWDGQALIFSGSQSTSVRANTQLSNEVKQEILKGTFESITITTLRGSVAGVSNE